jgi:hypothetical protein
MVIVVLEVVHPLFCLLQVPAPWMLEFLNSVIYSPYAGAESRSNVLSTAVNGEAINLPLFSGSLSKGAHDTGKNCWSIPEKDSFRVRSKRFLVDKSKVSSINLIPFHYQTCMLSHVP